MKNLRKILSSLLLLLFFFNFFPQLAYADSQEAVTTVALNFRDQGTVYSNVLSAIPAGESLTVLKTEGNWAQVQYEDQTGWVAARYLAPTEEVAKTVTLTNLKADTLRKEASSKAAALAKLPKGTKVNLVSVEKEWYKVEFKGKTGYVFAAGWIDAPSAARPVAKAAPIPLEGTIEVYNTTNVYMNAYDAMAKKGSVGTYPAGEYHIYRNFSGMLNVTRHPDVPGAWINPEEIRDDAPSLVKPGTTTATVTKPSVMTSEVTSGEHQLLTYVNTYVSAYDAQNDLNRVGKYAPGKYYVYKNYGGMLNISKTAGEIGAWINPAQNVAPVEPVTPPASEADQIVANATVNVRKGPSASFKVLRTLPTGSSAVMVGRESNWIKIEYKDQIGYSYINYWNIPKATLAKYPVKTTTPGTSPDGSGTDSPTTTKKLKVFLDPGHNGVAQGAVSTVTGELVDETTINYRVAILAKEILEDRGYMVYMSKSSLNQTVSLTERTNRANELGVDIYVSIHCNAYTDPASRGTIGFYAGEKLNPATSDWQAKSALLSQKLADSVGNVIGRSKIVKDTSYGKSFAVNRLTTMPSTLLELGFITNYQDAMILNSSANQKDLAREVANGIDNYFGR